MIRFKEEDLMKINELELRDNLLNSEDEVRDLKKIIKVQRSIIILFGVVFAFNVIF